SLRNTVHVIASSEVSKQNFAHLFLRLTSLTEPSSALVSSSITASGTACSGVATIMTGWVCALENPMPQTSHRRRHDPNENAATTLAVRGVSVARHFGHSTDGRGAVGRSSCGINALLFCARSA